MLELILATAILSSMDNHIKNHTYCEGYSMHEAEWTIIDGRKALDYSLRRSIFIPRDKTWGVSMEEYVPIPNYQSNDNAAISAFNPKYKFSVQKRSTKSDWYASAIERRSGVRLSSTPDQVVSKAPWTFPEFGMTMEDVFKGNVAHKINTQNAEFKNGFAVITTKYYPHPKWAVTSGMISVALNPKQNYRIESYTIHTTSKGVVTSYANGIKVYSKTNPLSVEKEICTYTKPDDPLFSRVLEKTYSTFEATPDMATLEYYGLESPVEVANNSWIYYAAIGIIFVLVYLTMKSK